MSELEDQIRGVLEDPQQMAQIMGLARSLMGGAAAGTEAPKDDGLAGKLGALMKQPSGGSQQELLLAIKPWLSEKRRQKVDRAIRISRMAHLAKIALKDMGGEGRA